MTKNVICNHLPVFGQILGSTNGIGLDLIINAAVLEAIIPPWMFLGLLIGQIRHVPNTLGP